MSKIETKMRERYEQRAETKEPKMRGWGEAPKPKGPPVRGAYKLLLIRTPGEFKTRHTDKAPSVDRMLTIGANVGTKFMARYWPSRKGWRLLDMREAQCSVKNGTHGRYSDWVGYRYLDTIFPDEDSVLMAAWALCAA